METTKRTLSRPRRGAMIAGVCAGLGRHFDMSPTTVRLLAVASCLLPGPQVVAYVILWIAIPRDRT
ncbi:PspC domain-containing protein [Sanguibacter antarcticus]|nr:PspC domain-containing protein [Sanguibacter antarcticus]